MSNIINSVARALDILLYINKQKGPVGISQISKDLETYKSTVFRTLATLESRNFVEQDKTTGKFTIGIALHSMASKITIYDVFKPFAKRLCNELHEAINISVMDNTAIGPYKSVIVVKEEDTENVLSASPKLGSSMYCYCSAVGKCLLAFSEHISKDVLAQYDFVKYTPNTIISLPDLMTEIKRVRKNGYGVDNEEKELGLTCVGVPILDKEGKAIAAISASGPTQRIQRINIESVVKTLKEYSAEITKLI